MSEEKTQRVPPRGMFHGFSYKHSAPMRLSGKEWNNLAEREKFNWYKVQGLPELHGGGYEVYLDKTDWEYK